MLDRKTPPPYHLLDKIDIIRAKTQYLNNGLPIHIINAGTQPIIKVEFIFSAGNYFELQPGDAYFTIKMLAEGTQKRSGQAISNYIDQFGAFSDFNHGVDRVSIGLYTLRKHLAELLPILLEIISQPSFPEKELNNLKNITLQNLQINQEKNNYVASRKFRKSIFGEGHPYGRTLSQEIITEVQPNQLHHFFQKKYAQQPFDIVLVGQIDEKVINQVAEVFSPLEISTQGKQAASAPPPPLPQAQQFLIEKEGSLQSSLRIGRRLFSKNHPDYFKLMVTNEIFGGYFGSRLMKNLREDKGFTYGVYSNLIMFNQDGYLVIGTDVKKEHTQQTLDEIYKEMNLMRTELVQEKELETVRNYIMGSFASSLSTPFDLADIFKSLYFNNLDYSFYDQYVHIIKNIQSDDILETAEKYLNPDLLTQVVVGGIS